MSNTLPKWNEDREAQLTAIVNGESPVSLDTVANAAEQLETTTRSISSKLRRMGVEVAKKVADAPAFDANQTAQLVELLTSNVGVFTAQEVADKIGDFTSAQIRGKLLSLDLIANLKPSEKAVSVRKYTPEQETRIVEMVLAGSFVEDIAAEMGKEVASIRGKCLSLLREHEGLTMPATRDKKGGAKADPYEDLDLESMSVEAIAEAANKTERAVKVHLTTVGLSATDYNGARKRAKADAKVAEAV